MRTSVVLKALLLGSAAVSFIACGPSPRQRPTGDDDGPGVDAANMPCVVSPEGADPTTCGDGIDNDCDGLVDCSDQNCSGVGTCPICGMVDTPLATPLLLPDGVGGNECTTDADCATVQPGPQRCYDLLSSFSGHECRQPYISTLDFVGFGQGQTFADPSNIVKVCVNMEHSYMRDLQMDLVAPDGRTVHLQKFAGQTGGKIHLGHPIEDPSSQIGVGEEYCWTPTATNLPTIDYANSGGTMLSDNGYDELPPGDYQASDPWTNLVGAPLNGNWEFVVTDLWPIDNGYLFNWSITFDANLVSDCSGPIIGRTGPQQ